MCLKRDDEFMGNDGAEISSSRTKLSPGVESTSNREVLDWDHVTPVMSSWKELSAGMWNWSDLSRWIPPPYRLMWVSAFAVSA